jgi:hypothetical protein
MSGAKAGKIYHVLKNAKVFRGIIDGLRERLAW